MQLELLEYAYFSSYLIGLISCSRHLMQSFNFDNIMMNKHSRRKIFIVTQARPSHIC